MAFSFNYNADIVSSCTTALTAYITIVLLSKTVAKKLESFCRLFSYMN